MRHFGGLDKGALNPKIVQGLIHVLDEHNGIVRLFRTARDRCNAGEIPGFKIRLYNMGGVRGYELPTSDILGGIVFESGPRSRTDFDVIIEVRERPPQRTNKLHQSYMSLQFPLGDHEGIAVGSKFMLPNTFTRGPRYKNELQDVPQIDEYISAEIPDPVEDARGYKLVIELIMHGPYGAAKLGPDRILSKISNSEASTSAPGNRKQIDEIQNYVDGLFICIYEACWRIFDFPIHSREPAIQILSVYLENMQHVTFRERDRLDSIVNLPKKKRQALSNIALHLWLLDVGNGEIGEPNEEDDQDSSWVAIPPENSVSPDETGLSQLIDFIYDDATLKTPTAGALQEKAIVCPKNNMENIVNAKILLNIQGRSKTYLSSEEAIPTGRETSEEELLYHMKYLRTITFPGFPPHELELKVGSLIMLL
ncbi:DNA helicase [Tanacetum coccineum]